MIQCLCAPDGGGIFSEENMQKKMCVCGPYYNNMYFFPPHCDNMCDTEDINNGQRHMHMKRTTRNMQTPAVLWVYVISCNLYLCFSLENVMIQVNQRPNTLKKLELREKLVTKVTYFIYVSQTRSQI